jgi:hypothetical protein
MSQVQPPRERPSNARPATIQILRWIIVNLGALLVTMLLLRLAIVSVTPDPAQTGLRALLRVTHFVTWPLAQIPPLATSLRGALTVADLATLIILVGAWIAAIGVVAGWEREGLRMGLKSNEERLKP